MKQSFFSHKRRLFFFFLSLVALKKNHEFNLFTHFWPSFKACRISVPQSGIKPMPSTVKAWSPTIGPPGNSQDI